MAMRLPELAPRILLVDDEVLLLRTLSSALREDGFDVLAASSAEDAERQLGEAGGVDLLVLDVKLPGKSGLDLLRERRDAGFRGRAVVMTAFDSPDTERVCRALAVDHYMRKPFDLERMLGVVRGLAGGAGDPTTQSESSTS
ncbi:MAG: response regulator [Candidatus Eisenbacteria bacterium]